MKILSNQNHPILEIHTGKGLKLIFLENIIFIKALNKGTMIYLDDSESFETKEILKTFEGHLPLPWFYRCHNSYIVNCKFVDCFSSVQISLMDNRRLPLSRKKKKLFKENLINYKQVSFMKNHSTKST